MNLKPRTMVHLFFLDQIPSEEELTAAKEAGVSEDEYRLRYYKLLFSGETVGFAFNQSPMSRSLVLQCLDFSSYWDACHATAIEYGPGGNAFYNQSSVYGANASLFDDIVNHQSEVLVGWLKKKPTTPGLQNVSGLAGGIISMLEAMGGIPTHFKGVNDFFTFSELRCRLLAQITAEEGDNTASKILSGKVFDEWLRNGIQNIGQQVTFRDMIKLLCSYIYYDFVPNPAAKYDKSIEGTTTGTYSTNDLNKQPAALKAIADLETAAVDIAGIQGYGANEQIKNGTRDVANRINDVAAALRTLGSTAKNAASKADSAFTVLANLVQDLTTNIALSKPDVAKALQDGLVGVNETKNLIIQNSAKVTVKTGTSSNATTARLRSQIFRPDCYFAAPPKCNVIFPEHFTSVSFDRMYLSEVTRSMTMAYNTLIGRDQMLADMVMAPNVGIDMAKVQKQVGASGYRILMPHERHTGIIPRSEWLPNTATFDASLSGGKEKLRGARLNWLTRAALFHFFKYRFGPRRINISGRFNPYVVCGFPATVILKPFIPSLAKVEQALKSTTVTSTEDQKVLDLVQTNGTKDVSLDAPYQFLGMVGNVSHSIDQSGGTTSISLHHGRRHLGSDDEFVGIFSESLVTQKKRVQIPLTAEKALSEKNSKVRDSLLQALVGVTPQQAQVKAASKRLNKTSKKSKEYSNASKDPRAPSTLKTRDISQTSEVVQSTSNLLVDENGRIDGLKGSVQTPKPAGTVTRGSDALFDARGKGKVVGIQVKDANLQTVLSGTFKGKQIYTSVIVYEDLDIAVEESVPVEEIIRPTWFSAKYSNPKIGKDIYGPFFGTTSIIDNLAFTGLVPDTLFVPDNPDGESYDPQTKFKDIKKDLQDKDKTRSRLSIERAVNVIAYFYGLVRTQGKDIDKFVNEFTARPIATMLDIFGTPDLAISYSGKGVPTISKGSPGFHSLSLDPTAIKQGGLAGLLSDPDKQIPRINNSGDKAPISPVYDVRAEKLEQVRAYMAALANGPGIKG